MRIALLQYPVVWANVDENLRLTEERLERLKQTADLALLPEMFTTGFCPDRPDLADVMHNGTCHTLETLRAWARTYNIAIAGSFMCREDEHLYNRGFFVRPDGTADFVNKRHLYASGGEAALFTPGDTRIVSEYMGVKLCLLVCYDLRFPVWSRNSSGFDYDILLYVAAWPEQRIAAWDILLPARGLENQCYVAGVNCVGNDGLGLHYNGHSVAYDTRLNQLVSFADDEEGTKIADFDIEKLRHFREVLPLWKDSDSFTIKSSRIQR